jgi:hypothetical protein
VKYLSGTPLKGPSLLEPFHCSSIQMKVCQSNREEKENRKKNNN